MKPEVSTPLPGEGLAGNVLADEFAVRFWGVRGSIACAGPQFEQFGGNTPCVEMRVGGHVLVFDVGSGARALGSRLIQEGVRCFDLFFSHCHYDHIEGMPFFEPLYRSEIEVTVWSGHHQDGSTTQDMLQKFMHAPFFPVGPEVFRAKMHCQTFLAGECLEPRPGIRLQTTRLQHCNGCVGYRVEFGGKSACYVTDTEHPETGLDEAIVALIADADVVIYDTMYTPEEYRTRKGFGHSTWIEGVRLCEAANARQLVLFHHNPAHDDATLAAIERDAASVRPGTIAAREGLMLAV